MSIEQKVADRELPGLGRSVQCCEIARTTHGVMVAISNRGTQLPRLVEQLGRHGVRITGVDFMSPTLEADFTSITGTSFTAEWPRGEA